MLAALGINLERLIMQNMEKYYGFKVKVTDSLEPDDYEILHGKANTFAAQEGMELSDYYVYLHQLVILPNEQNFEFEGSLDKRVSMIRLEFSVNQKQLRNKKIRFLNHVMNIKEEQFDIRPYYLPHEIGYLIPSSYFVGSPLFQNAIVTFVHRDIRQEHKKIKVSVAATPTKEYEPLIKSVLNQRSTTQLDIKFNKQIQLNLPLAESRMATNNKEDGKTVYNNTFNNYGQAGAMGLEANASGFTNQLYQAGDLNKLSLELVALLKEINTNPDVEMDQTEALLESIEAANLANVNGVGMGLKKVSSWTLGVAEKIGVPIAIAAIKQYTGL